MSKRTHKTSGAKSKTQRHVHVHVHLDEAGDTLQPKRKMKAAPKSWNTPVDGEPARVRLDRPGRRMHKADGGPTTQYRAMKIKESDADRGWADFERKAGVAHGLGATGAAALGMYPAAAALGLGSLANEYLANRNDTRATDRDAQAGAVEDLINRSRGTDLRSRAFGATPGADPDAPDPDLAEAGHKRGGPVRRKERSTRS